MIYSLFTLIILFFTPCCSANYTYTLSICAIFQDEAPYLKEWIEFHRLVGVEHFYLYNHRSKDKYKEVLQPYIQAGIVELFDREKVAHRIQIFNSLQCKCYNECLAYAKGKSKWVAFIDIDEFLFPTSENTLPSVLKNFDNFGGVYANWRIFGTSQMKTLPHDKLLIESLTSCSPKTFPANNYIKSIVRPEYAVEFPNPHHPIYKKGYFQVNTDKIPYEEAFVSSYIQANKLRINHYWTRTEDFFFHVKIPRQKRWGGTPISEQILSIVNREKDDAILRFAPALRERMMPAKH